MMSASGINTKLHTILHHAFYFMRLIIMSNFLRIMITLLLALYDRAIVRFLLI